MVDRLFFLLSGGRGAEGCDWVDWEREVKKMDRKRARWSFGSGREDVHGGYLLFSAWQGELWW
jgi:hypothetical protein